MFNKNSKTVLVTGGAGYIGSELVRIMLQDDYRVVVLDNLSFGGESLLSFWGNPAFRFIKGDLLNDEDVKKALEGVHYVCHLAAIVGEPPCKKFPDLALQVNWHASVRLYELCEEAGIERFVFASTCSNYGKMAIADDLLDESADLNPISLYSETKVNFEKYLLSHESSTITRTILRFSTVYGISPRPRFDLTVNEFTRDAALGKPLLIYGENFWRPYCHVSDLARSVKMALEADKDKIDGEAFNVGDTAQNYTKKMLAAEIGREIPSLEVNYHPVVTDPRDYKVNCDKIKRVLGFEISKTVPNGIQEIASLFREQVISEPMNPRYGNV
ncbi:NAD-dependent epimerase/dehydratase family protein [Dyadobacter fermentans]|uniref:NAD-dependent epimerase/dehydratase n=1 Tax=Dyadobacter fermentans (strain ATCC 700827 / DSM 18053 / CIP 107007 / KCTC 52180 / NS114) TaxID=471854 RepID=C6VS98_DYAFD|nr:NAD-dependent epimerase/dehydratase family protein [Dyadobacter fermentans]ACT96333.1 NAD-dependent epimerase/dehydratase [Dyadobacter fermentans DSM 18053]